MKQFVTNVINVLLDFVQGWGSLVAVSILWLLKVFECYERDLGIWSEVIPVFTDFVACIVALSALVIAAYCTPVFAMKRKPRGAVILELQRKLTPIETLKRACGSRFEYMLIYFSIIWGIVLVISIRMNCLPEGATFINCAAALAQSVSKDGLIKLIKD